MLFATVFSGCKAKENGRTGDGSADGGSIQVSNTENESTEIDQADNSSTENESTEIDQADNSSAESGGTEIAEFVPFFRFDVDSPTAWKEPLSNVRFLTEGAYELKPLDAQKMEQYGLSPDSMPDTKGMDTLNISGSAEFSEDQFRDLAEQLRELAKGKEIWIVDCRIEGHALLNGISVSWYGDNNWANKGMTLEEAEKDEQERFGALVGKEITAYSVLDNAPDQSEKIAVETCMTERELVQSEGFNYLRLPCQDHSWPYEEAIDTFIDFVQSVDTDQVWLHFHCQAGKSRTGIFMAIYDMMQNPDVPFEDIMLRHAMTGSSYFPYVDESSDIADVYALRAKRIRQVYDYIQEMDGDYTTPWSTRLKTLPPIASWSGSPASMRCSTIMIRN